MCLYLYTYTHILILFVHIPYKQGVVCANVGLETKYIFIQRVENDHLVFHGGLREKGNMAKNSSSTILLVTCLRS